MSQGPSCCLLSLTLTRFCGFIRTMTLNLRLKTFIGLAAMFLFLSAGTGVAGDKPSIAILPLKLNAPPGMEYLKGAYRDVIAARLSAADAILVEDQSKLQAAERDGSSDLSEDTKKALAGKIGAGFLLDGSLSLIADDLSLDLRLIKVDVWTVFPMTYKGKGIGSFTEMLEKVAAESRSIILGGTSGKVMGSTPVAVKDKGPAAKEKAWKSQRLPLALKGIAVEDIDNDGIKDFVAIDDKNLYIYSFDKDGLKLKKEFKGIGASWNCNIAIGDFNGNGIPEIYLSRKYMEKAATRVIEFTGKDFVIIADDLPWFIRSVKGPDKALLVGEKFRQVDGLYGGVKFLNWKDGTLREDGALDMPKWMGLYGFTFCDATGDGKDDFIYLDENDRMRLYEKGDDGTWKQTWRSTSYYGGSLNNIEVASPSTEQNTINVKAEIVCGRVMEDGRREVIITSNDATSRVFKNISYESGEIRGLLWSEFGMEDTWRTKKINGYVADYSVVDLKKVGLDEIVELVVTKQPSLFSAGESLIVTLAPEINLQIR